MASHGVALDTGLGLLVLGVALVLAAAKAHGRQVRLERELAGYHEVDFTGSNPPFVEALWARDRRRFWLAFLVLGSLGMAYLAPALLRRPVQPDWWVSFGIVAAWVFAGSFAVAGLSSLARFARARAQAPAERAPWARAALRGSAAWWGLVAALGAGVPLLLATAG